MERVIQLYERTFIAEEAARFVMCSKSADAFESVQIEFGGNLKAVEGTLFEHRRRQYGIEQNAISKLHPREVFKVPEVLAAFNGKLWNYHWTVDSIPRCGRFSLPFHERQNAVLSTMNLLEEIGYWADPFKKYRSQMHDVSHAIYASMADVLVTDDERFRQRVEAAYDFLEVPTAVVSPQDFLEWIVTVPVERCK
jgi:hypothetical protein